eukprot:1139636-Pelagomonas_calceolata.AAC.7
MQGMVLMPMYFVCLSEHEQGAFSCPHAPRYLCLQVARAMKGSVMVAAVDADAHSSLASEYGIKMCMSSYAAPYLAIVEFPRCFPALTCCFNSPKPLIRLLGL